MVAHRVDAQVELGRDLPRRPAALEQVEHLRLARRERKVGMLVRRLDEIGHLAEHADDVLAVPDGYRADLDCHAVAVRVDELEARRP